MSSFFITHEGIKTWPIWFRSFNVAYLTNKVASYIHHYLIATRESAQNSGFQEKFSESVLCWSKPLGVSLSCIITPCYFK